MERNGSDTNDNNHAHNYPTLYDLVPDFETETTQGPIRLSEWYPDKWVLLFSHPADFTPVCTSEFIELSKREEDFEALDTKLLGLSVDSLYSHIGWLENIREKFGVEISFPIIADKNREISESYGIIHPRHDTSATVRSVFVLDTERRLQARLQYPREVGRNVDELLRLVEGLRTSQKQGVELPANWTPGDSAVHYAPLTAEEARERRETEPDATEWYFTETDQSENSDQ